MEPAFETIGIHRLEARATVTNDQVDGALAKSGGAKEGVLSFLPHGQHLDQTLWSLVRDDWRQAKAVWGSIIH